METAIGDATQNISSTHSSTTPNTLWLSSFTSHRQLSGLRSMERRGRSRREIDAGARQLHCFEARSSYGVRRSPRTYCRWRTGTIDCRNSRIFTRQMIATILLEVDAASSRRKMLTPLTDAEYQPYGLSYRGDAHLCRRLDAMVQSAMPMEITSHADDGTKMRYYRHGRCARRQMPLVASTASSTSPAFTYGQKVVTSPRCTATQRRRSQRQRNTTSGAASLAAGPMTQFNLYCTAMLLASLTRCHTYLRFLGSHITSVLP